MIRVLFVCLGNICRSPMAEAVFRQMVTDAGLTEYIAIDSAGIGGWHAGEPPHQGTRQVLSRHGISFEGIRSRQIQKKDLNEFDYIVAMDEHNLQDIKRLGSMPNGKVFRILELVEESFEKDVPDPYYTGNFDQVYDLINRGCEQLLLKIKEDLQEEVAPQAPIQGSRPAGSE